MSKIEELIASGDISPEDLVEAEDLIERAKLVQEGLNACKQTISFPLGKKKVQCYFQNCETEDNEGYNVWGECDTDGEFICISNQNGKHIIGRCNLLDFEKTFMAFSNEKFARHLKKFLKEQIVGAR